MVDLKIVSVVEVAVSPQHHYLDGGSIPRSGGGRNPPFLITHTFYGKPIKVMVQWSNRVGEDEEAQRAPLSRRRCESV